MNHESLCAVVGNPIQHSLSPQIHQAFAKALAIPLRYERFLSTASDFQQTVMHFFAQGGRGLNITVPFKEQAFQMAKQYCSTRALMAAAVNTLWYKNGNLHGCNTDGEGLVYDLKRLNTSPKGKKILLIGAGGAAKGVVIPLLEAGCIRLKIINRTPERAQQLVQQIQQHLPQHQAQISAGHLQQTQGEWDIVINATSASLDKTTPKISPVNYTANALAYDMVYGAQPTPFMQAAKAQGAAIVADGLGMLVEQAASSFAIWFGQRPPTQAILKELRIQLQNNAQET